MVNVGSRRVGGLQESSSAVGQQFAYNESRDRCYCPGELHRVMRCQPAAGDNWGVHFQTADKNIGTRTVDSIHKQIKALPRNH